MAASAALLALVSAAPPLHGQDREPPPEPSAIGTDEIGADDDPGNAADDVDVVVTASRHEESILDTPYSVTVIERDALRTSPDNKTLPDTLTRVPGILLQKTGPAQASPYIRGFTGFRTLWLVDGIRLNNSVWRDGPNQYPATIDLYSVDRLELIRGPSSVLWGSDAVGGVVNALSRAGDADAGWRSGLTLRYATGERSMIGRIDFQGGEPDDWAIRGGASFKDYNSINAGQGSGDLSNTGFGERDYDVRFDKQLADSVTWTLAAQQVRQWDAPRTHKTVDSVPFHGTVAGTELQRELDQERDLLWTRLAFDEPGGGGLWDAASVTYSWQRQRETQDRWRTGGRFDERGFDVITQGVQFQAERESPIGLLTYGVDHYHDDVDSFRNDYVDGVSTGDHIQGNIADDATYDLSGVYVQNEIVHGPWETTMGVRWNRASVDADKVDNPNVPGSDPSTPGNIIGVDESWDDLVGSLRTLRRIDEQTIVYAGISQGFRAPNLSDLTADLEDSGIEQPAPQLEPEHFVSIELGTKTERDDGHTEFSVYYTWIRDFIVRSPTGELVDDLPVFQKDNVGDGFVWGFEFSSDHRLAPEWTLYSSAAWLDGKVDQFELPSGDKVSKPLDRTMPFTAVLGVAYEPVEAPWWVQADVLMAAKADKLSLRDETDVERIPPGGTPGYAVFGVRGGRQIDERTTVGLGLENILDKDYRIHGSGQNEPGRSLVLSWNVAF